MRRITLAALQAALLVCLTLVAPCPVSAQSCQQLVAYYDGSNWWWGAFGNCKTGPGGPVERASIFQCAWNQVRQDHQRQCLKDALLATDQTRRGIDEVAAFNGPPNNCNQLTAKYDYSNWWWGAFGNCKRQGGPVARADIFQCAWAQVPAGDQKQCLKDALLASDYTRQGIDVVAAFNDPSGCNQLIARYNGSSWWWGAFGNCKKTDGPLARADIFECAWGQVSPADQQQCLRDALGPTNQTREGIDDVAAHNWPVSNNRSVVVPSSPETCHAASVGTGYFAVPAALTAAATAPYLGEGRLRSDLRVAAQAADPIDSLRWAAHHLASGNTELGNAFADLSVTGRRTFAQFMAAPPTDAMLFQSIKAGGGPAHCAFGCRTDQHCEQGCSARPALPSLNVPDDQLMAACHTALDRAYAVAHILRVSNVVALPDGSIDSSGPRRALGWIAVSGEDDRPYRPVNVPSTKYPQYDLTVPVQGIDVHARYVIAQSQAPFATTVPAPGRKMTAPPAPVLAGNAAVLIFVHGMDSRAEEAESLTDALRAAAMVKGENVTVISVDLPTSGYTDSLDHCGIPRPVTGSARCDSLFALGDPKEPPQFFDAHDQHNAPALDFIEEFIVRFVDTLDQQVPVKSKVRAVIGGSLGGNMGLRLGRRLDTPWIRNVVAWSPGSIWDSLADGSVRLPTHISLNHLSVKTTWMNAGGNPEELAEADVKRGEFFNVAFDKPYLGAFGPTQPQTWHSDRWPCKAASITASRLDRLETYDKKFRLWHWRLAAEQLIFSHTGFGPNGQPLYMSNGTRTLLACGGDDDFLGAKICSATQLVAAKMTLTPGRAIFLQDTGHALDGEHPNFMAGQIMAFLGL